MEDIKGDIQEEPGSVGDVNLIDDHQFKALCPEPTTKLLWNSVKLSSTRGDGPLSRKVH